MRASAQEAARTHDCATPGCDGETSTRGGVCETCFLQGIIPPWKPWTRAQPAPIGNPLFGCLKLTVYGDPQTSGSKIPGVTKTGRTYVRDDNPSSRDWKRSVAQAAGIAMRGAPLLDGPLELTLAFHRPRPKVHTRANGGLKMTAPPFPVTRPDVLKLARAIEDSLTGIVYRDDSQIVREHLSKDYGEPSRVEIAVWQIAPG